MYQVLCLSITYDGKSGDRLGRACMETPDLPVPVVLDLANPLRLYENWSGCTCLCDQCVDLRVLWGGVVGAQPQTTPLPSPKQ